MSSKTFHYVRALTPQADAAWKARAEIFWAECRAAHDESSERSIAKILAAEAAATNAAHQPLPMAA
jgi:hypothetical protein